MKKIILIGGGGHCKVVIDTILSTNEFEIIGILDLEENVGKAYDSVLLQSVASGQKHF